MNKMGHTLPSIDTRDSNAAELVYQKATVKYERDPNMDADSDIAKRTFYIQVRASPCLTLHVFLFHAVERVSILNFVLKKL